jgi:putative transposase
LKLKKHFNEIRREQFPWTWDVTKNAYDQPFFEVGKAFTAFFEGRARCPTFKSKKRSKPSFSLANDQLELGDHRIWVPKLGWVNMAENLRFAGKVTGARITNTAQWWLVSIQVELPDEIPAKNQVAVGIDVGLNRLAILSTGEGVENQAFLKTALGKLRQANKRLHRRKVGSKNREKARRQVARLQYRMACLRDDVLQKLTTRLANGYGMIGMEDLNRVWVAQEPQAGLFVLRRRVGQTLVTFVEQGRAARRASDQGRPFLCFHEDLPWLRVEVGRYAVV